MADARLIHGGGFGVPVTGLFSANTFQLNATTDAVKWAIDIEAGVVISKLGFLPTAITGTATTWRISIQGRTTSASGYVPSGTVLGGGTPASATFTNASLTAGTFAEITLANTYTPSTTEQVFIVLEYSSGTSPSAGVNDLTVGYSSNIVQGSTNYPFCITTDAGTDTRVVTQPLTVSYSDGTTVYGWPTQANISLVYNSGSSPAVYGIKVKPPAGISDTFKVRGARIYMATAAFTSEHIVHMNLYDGTNVIQQAITTNRDGRVAGAGHYTFLFQDATLDTLTCGNDYYLALAPQSTTSFTLRGVSFNTAAQAEAMRSMWNGGYWSFDGATWTETNTSHLFIEAIFEDITEAAASSNVFFIEG